MTLSSRVTLTDCPRAAVRVDRYAREHSLDSWTAADRLVGAALDREEGRDPAPVAARLERFGIIAHGMTAAAIRAKGIHVAAEIDDSTRLQLVGGEWRWMS